MLQLHNRGHPVEVGNDIDDRLTLLQISRARSQRQEVGLRTYSYIVASYRLLFVK